MILWPRRWFGEWKCLFCKSYNLSFDPRNTGDTSRKLMHESQNFYDEIKGKQKICLWLCGPVSLQYRVEWLTQRGPASKQNGRREPTLQKLLFDRQKHRTAYVYPHIYTVNKVSQEPVAGSQLSYITALRPS